MDSTLSIRVPGDVKDALERLAKATGRSRSRLAMEAIKEYLAEQAWQLAEIEQAIKEADAGDFASSDEVRATLQKWS